MKKISYSFILLITVITHAMEQYESIIYEGKKLKTALYAPWRETYLATKQKTNTAQTITEDPFCRMIGSSKESDKENLILKRGKYITVFMNLNPYTPGHILVIPNTHTNALENLSKNEYKELNNLRDYLAHMFFRLGFDTVHVGFNLGKCSGASIPDHIHMHIIPRYNSIDFPPNDLADKFKNNINQRYAISQFMMEDLPKPPLPGVKEMLEKHLKSSVLRMYDLLKTELSKTKQSHSIKQKLTTPKQPKKRSCKICTQKNSKLVLHKGKGILVTLKKTNNYSLGHIIITPREHRTFLQELSQEERNDLNQTILIANKIVKTELKASGTNIGINITTSPPEHLEIHVVPRHPPRGFEHTIASIHVITKPIGNVFNILKKAFEKVKTQEK